MASATLSGVRPPASRIRSPDGAPSASDQSNTWPEPGLAESSITTSAPYVGGAGERGVAGGEGLDDERDPLADPRGLGGGLVAVQLGGAQAGLLHELDDPLRRARRGTRRR